MTIWKAIFTSHNRQDPPLAYSVQRGIILHGLPGNGKTISIKALMHSLACRSPQMATLYVKSLGKSSNQDDIREIFQKARETAPCLIVFEDIDSLVTDTVRSFFLNEVDGLEGNDGIMMIGSTNYCKLSIRRPPTFIYNQWHLGQWIDLMRESRNGQVVSTASTTFLYQLHQNESATLISGGS